MNHNQPAHSIFWGAVWGFLLWIVIIALGVGLISCTQNPVSVARTPEQKFYALYGEFVILEETAARMTQDPAVPAPVITAIRETDAKAKPATDAMLRAYRAYETAKASSPATDPTPLNNWITTVATDLVDLNNAIKGIHP